jgi:hypothetical protein
MKLDIFIHKLQQKSVFEHYFTKGQLIYLMLAFLMLEIVSGGATKKSTSFFLSSAQTKFSYYFHAYHQTQRRLSFQNQPKFQPP